MENQSTAIVDDEKKIAIVGVAFRLPEEIDDLPQLWHALVDGRDLIANWGQDRWDAKRYFHPRKSERGKSYTQACGLLKDLDKFDAKFFGITPREARQLDPRQRLLLELTWHALESSNHKPSTLRGSNCGVYVGVSGNEYSSAFYNDLSLVDPYSMTGNVCSIAANRISYFYDFKGPSMAIDTACSSAVVAIHQACNAIKAGEVDAAIAGSAGVNLHPLAYVGFSKSKMLSPTGRCRTFDDSADGYVRSEGAVVFYLKSLKQAQLQGDFIHAVILNSGVNSDGKTTSLPVPSSEAQRCLLEKTLRESGVQANQIDYLEAHGTGTPVGDPAEISAIKQAYTTDRSEQSPLWVGSIKSNLGHLEVTSGMAGLLKLLAMMRYRAIPPSIHIDALNKSIDFGGGKIAVAQQTVDLSDNDNPLVFGLNCFGFGGTNTHLLLTEPPKNNCDAKSLDANVEQPPLVLSAKNAPALQALAADYARLIREDGEHYYDIAYNTYYHREKFDYTCIFDSQDLLSLVTDLEKGSIDGMAQMDGACLQMSRLGEDLPVCFVFSGNGSQWCGMGQALMARCDVFRTTIQQISELYLELAGHSIEAMLANNDSGLFDDTSFAQPALFAIQMGIVAHLKQLGLIPTAVVGHSVGEVAAACTAGAISLQQAVKLIYVRSTHQHMIHQQGGMVALSVGKDEGEALLRSLSLDKQLDIAGVNSPNAITLSGEDDAIGILLSHCEQNNILAQRLPLAYPFHSSALISLETSFLSALGELTPTASKIDFYSSVFGRRVEGTCLDTAYWWKNVLNTVEFNAPVSELLQSDITIFVEVGPHPVLKTYVKDIARHSRRSCVVVETLNRHNEAINRLDHSAYQAWGSGAGIDESRYFPVKANFYNLPKYPWQKESFWLKSNKNVYDSSTDYSEHPLLGWRCANGLLIWENHIDTVLLPYLADHQIQAGTVLPAAAMFEMANVAVDYVDDKERFELHNFEVLAPLLLDNDVSYLVRTEVQAAVGTVTIKSRRRHSEEPWLVNAKANFLGSTAYQFALPDALAGAIGWQQIYDKAAHYNFAKEMGLHYGPAFQGITAVKVDEPYVFAAVAIPESIQADVSEYQMHPGLLDVALQSIICVFKNHSQQLKDRGFLPVGVERLCLVNSLVHLAGVYGHIIKRTSRQLVANFYLVDSKGRLLAILKGCRFTQVIVNRDVVEYCDYAHQAVFQSVVNTAQPLGIDTLSTIARDVNQHVGINSTYYSNVGPLIDSLIARFVIDALKPFLISGNHSFETLCRMLGVVESQYSFFQHGLNILEEDGYVILDQDDKYIWQSKDNELPLAQLIWLSLLGDYPQYISELIIVGRIGMSLLSVWQGHMDAQELFALQQRSGTYQHLLSNAPTVEYKYFFLERAVTSLITTYQSSRQVQLLWCGVDQGQVVQKLIKTLQTLSLNVVITVNIEDTQQASFLEGIIQDDNISVITDSLETMSSNASRSSERFDIVVLAEDLHHLEHPKMTISSAKRLLSADGVLITSFTMPERRLDFIEGINLDWWVHCQNGKAVSRLRSNEYWKKLLREMGLIFDTALSDAGDNVEEGCRVLLCQNIDQALCIDDKPEVETILIYEGVLNKHLENQIHFNTFCYAGVDDITGILVTIRQQVSSCERPIRIVLLPYGDSHHQASYQHWVALIQQLLSFTADLGELLPQGSSCWLVTRFAKPSRVDLAIDTIVSPVQQMLWGLLRVAMNEYQHLSLKCIDLQCHSLIASAEWLFFEENCQDVEQEIVYANGARYFLRVKQQQIGNPPSRPSTNVYLSFDEPGPLKNLQWYGTEIPVLADDEVLIATKSVGLNFRDVMYAMRLITDEAVENGFLGPTLGMELAGDVLAVGSGIKHMQVGDRVMGFAPNSLSSVTKTKGNALVRVPDDWSYHQAATVPTAFFTAYYALEYLAKAQPEETILIHGAAGAVGIAAIQIAHFLELKIIATAGTNEKRDFLSMLGVAHVFDSRSHLFADQIMAVTGGQGVDIILNSLSGEAISRNLSILKPFGRFLELGKRDFYENSAIGLKPFKDNLSYFGIDADQLLIQRPALAQRLFKKVINLFKEAVLRPLPYRVFGATQIADAFRYMQQSKQIGKIIVSFERIPVADRPLTEQAPTFHFNPQAFCVITGGLSGFGLATAIWCAEQGVTHLCLISRTGHIDEQAQLALDRMKSLGTEVVVASADVTNADVLYRCLDALPLPIDGIFHCAAAYDDAMLHDMTDEQWECVISPKVIGADHLDAYTRKHPVNYFVLYSSATTMFGNPGQANYVAANCYMEGLVAKRRHLGLPGHYVAWGAVGDVGLLSRKADVKRMMERSLGQELSTTRQLLQWLPHVLASSAIGHTVLELSFVNTLVALPNGKHPTFNYIYPQASLQQRASSDSLQIEQLLKDKTPREIEEVVANLLADEVAAIVYLPRDSVPLNQSIQELGIDSLMGVELVRAIEQRFQVSIPMLSLSESPTLRKMAKKVVAQLLKKEQKVAHDTSETGLTAQIEHSFAQHGQSVSQEELDKVVNRIHKTRQGKQVETST